MSKEVTPLRPIDEIISLIEESHSLTTPGKWCQGMSTHHTVSKRAGKEDYPIATFKHADDASFIDVAHEHIPRLLAEIKSLREELKKAQAVKG